MIISFNPDLFFSHDEKILEKLARILTLILEDRHLVDTRSLGALLTLNSISLFKSISLIQHEGLKKYIFQKSGFITQLHKRHLSFIVIGIQQGEIHPDDAYHIINERSKVVVENGVNDWKFIEGICKIYSTFGVRKNIYALIKKSISNHWIESENAGGSGGIMAGIKVLVEKNHYRNVYKYKIVSVFDSDRNNPLEVKKDLKNLISFLKKKDIADLKLSDCIHEDSDLIFWHMLYKRELENYVPLDILYLYIHGLNREEKDFLECKTPAELDFIKYEEYISLGNKKIKMQFPEIFSYSFSPQSLEERCKHHKVYLNETMEEVSEIEQLLLKIAKVI